MPATLTKAYDWSLVVDEQELRRLVHEMAGVLAPGTVKFGFTVNLGDGFSHTTGNIEEVLREENRAGHTMSGLVVSITDDQKSMVVAMGTEKDKGSRLTVNGDARDWVYVTFSQLEDRLRRMKGPDGGRVLKWAAAAVVLVSGVVLYQLMTKYPDAMWQSPKPDGKTPATGFGLLVFVSPLAALLATAVLAQVLYPRVTFRIGDGVRRDDRLVDIRKRTTWALITGVGVAGAMRLFWMIW